MLPHPTQERLLALGLTGMAKALDDQRRQPDIAALSFEERLALLLDREAIERENKRLVAASAIRRLAAGSGRGGRRSRAPRGLDRALFQKLAAGDWIDRQAEPAGHRPDRRRQVMDRLRARPQGVPRQPLRAYHRVPRLLEALALARGDGR